MLFDKSGEDWRRRCEVRHILRLRAISRAASEHYIDGEKMIKDKRGEEAAKKLRDDCAAQWSLGNRGDKGDWR